MNNIIKKIGLYTKNILHNIYKFCWITDYPLYKKDYRGRINFFHNPFSYPKNNIYKIKNLSKIKAIQYDIVCNGIELSSGALRNYNIKYIKQIII